MLKFFDDLDSMQNDTAVSTYYNSSGFSFTPKNASELADYLKDNICLAKTDKFSDRTVYWLKADRTNIIDVTTDSFLRNNSKWNFMQVNQECFDSYVSFLKTRKLIHLTNAQRSVHDGKR